MKEEYQDRIDNYLLGRMSEAERVSFERDLNLDDKLKEQYEFTKAVKNALMMEKIEEDISRWDQEYVKEKSKKPKSQRRAFYWISGIAAMFVVGFFLYNPHKMKDDVEPTLRGTGNMENVEQMLENKEYDSALSIMEKQEERLKLQIDSLEVQKEILHLQMDEILWLKAKVLVDMNRIPEAIRILDEIRHSESDYHEVADSMYNELYNRIH